MLARASSDAGTRLRRSKSTSTVHRRPPSVVEAFDPDVSQQHALAAAMVAFSRAQAHEAVQQEKKTSSEMSRSKSNASHKSLTSQGQGSHFPPRGISFRSSQPQKTTQSQVTRRQSRSPTINTEKFPPFFPDPNLNLERPLSAPRPLSTQPSIAFSEYSRPSTQPKAGRQSASSSITSQQIRKARSMYYASSVQTGSPIARPPAKYLTTPPPITISPVPDIPVAVPHPRSLGPSPLTEPGPRLPVTVAADESVDKARDKYLQSFQQRSIKHKPSLFMAPFMKRQDRSKDKSKRLSSGLMTGPTVVSSTPDESTDMVLNEFMPGTDKKDKRSFSGSLKSKFKRVFRRTSNKTPSLPVQQIDASREYFANPPLDVQNTGEGYVIPSPEEEMLQRVRARTPSMDPGHPQFLRSTSRTSSNGSARSNRSNRSLHSETNATTFTTSRVTSWGTSVSGDTAAQRALKRLTVIHEAKDSIGSEKDPIVSSFMKRKSLPPGALAAFREPMPMQSLLEETSDPVDPKRVFSALMKEIGASKDPAPTFHQSERTPGAESDVFESSITKGLHSDGRDLHPSTSTDFRPSTGYDQRPPSRRAPSAAAESSQGKASSLRTLGRAIRSTIRTVTPGDHRSSPCPETSDGARSEFHLPNVGPQSSPSPEVHELDEDCVRIETGITRAVQPTPVFSPSVAQIEKRVERAKNRWKTPLEDVEKLQFPRETDRTYIVANYTQQDTPNDLGDTLDRQLRTVRTDLPTSPTPHPLMSPLSPSVYSRNTDGVSILPNDSVVSFNGTNGLERHHNGGSAVILTSQAVRSYIVGTPSPKRPDSIRSSRDWKAWLSHEVSSMEFTSKEDLKIDESYMTPSGKHRRDFTRTSHTEQEETTVILRASCDTATPRADTIAVDGKNDKSIEVKEDHGTETLNMVAFERSQSHPDTFKESSPGITPPRLETSEERKFTSRPESIPLLTKTRGPSNPSHSYSASQPLLETPRSSRMNDRFPYINTGRRSSNNSARSSRLSRSPPDSLTSSSLKSAKGTPSPRIYSDLSVPSAGRSSQFVTEVASKRNVVLSQSKENITPPLTSGIKTRRPKISPLGRTPRPNSLQPLSSAALNRSSTNMNQYTSNDPNLQHSKHKSSPAADPQRPRVRVTLRHGAPDKLARRPKSAFDLRGTNYSLPRPASDIRRPALQLKPSTSSLALSKEPSPGTEDRVIDSILEDGERSGSVTPGQRMADRFLRERKSTGVLEGKHRGGLRLVREDTPAFL